MKRIALVCLIVFTLLLTATGCGKKKSATISVSLDGVNHISSIKEGDALTYKIMGEDYIFEIYEITDEEIKIKADKAGLASSGSLLSVETDFVVKKGEKLELHTQTTDYQETITFSY